MCATNMSGYAYQHLPQALQENMINLTQLRIAATRTLRLRFELGLQVHKQVVQLRGETSLTDRL